MPDYRFEHAVSGRAKCQNTKCKKEGIPIPKGEFRMGTLVMFQEQSTWQWKHWGCVTPRQIANLQDMLEGLDIDDDRDMEIIDGWDVVDEESQEKIREALRVGHVADEEWKGELELNRPGMKGINKRTPKKKAVSEEPEDEADPESPVKKAKASKAAIKQEDEEHVDPQPKTKSKSKKVVKQEEEEDVKPMPKAKSKKAVKEEEHEEMEPKPKSTVKSKKAGKKEEPEEPESKPKPKSRARKAIKQEEEDAVSIELDIKPKTTRKRKAKEAVEEPTEEPAEDSVEEPEEEPAPKPKSKKSKVTPKQEETAAVEDIKPAKKARKSRKKSAAEVEDQPATMNDQVDGAADESSNEPAPKARKSKKATKVKAEAKDVAMDDIAPLANSSRRRSSRSKA